MTPSTASTTRLLRQSVPVVLVAGCIIAALNVGPRASMGFFLTPMATAYGWDREIFALAIAIQNLAWGIGQPFVGMLADKFGTGKVLTGGALLYGLGLVLMSETSDPVALQLTAGVLIGLGIAGSAFLLVLAAFSRLLPPGLRPLGYGLGTAAGSAGQFIFAPLGQGIIQAYGWQSALLVMAAMVLIIPLLAGFIRGKPDAATALPGEKDQSIVEALREAFRHRSYQLLVAGFFVCGFQIAFITVHLPPYLADIGIPALYGGYAIGLVGLFNIIGSIGSGVLTGRMPKRIILAAIYFARSAVILIFILTPPSTVAVLLFSAAIGLLWLSTIPPTQQIVAVMFGTRYLATLFGFVFFSHQVGSFLGIWLGGFLFDRTGSYDAVWWISIGLGIFAGLVNLPIVERPVRRLAPA